MSILDKTLNENAYTILNLVELMSELNETPEGFDTISSNDRIKRQLEYSSTMLAQMLQSIEDRKNGR
jgi:hypothetical protein